VNPTLVAKFLRKSGHYVSLKDVYNRRAKLTKRGLCGLGPSPLSFI